MPPPPLPGNYVCIHFRILSYKHSVLCHGGRGHWADYYTSPKGLSDWLSQHHWGYKPIYRKLYYPLRSQGLIIRVKQNDNSS